MAATPDRIIQLYQQYLGRSPSQDEIDGWVNQTYGPDPESQIPSSGEANDYRQAHGGSPPPQSGPAPGPAPGPTPGPAPGPAPPAQGPARPAPSYGGGPGAVSRPEAYGGSPYGGPIFGGSPYTGPIFQGSPYSGPIYKGSPMTDPAYKGTQFTGTPYQAPTFKAPSGASYAGSPQLNVSAGMRPGGTNAANSFQPMGMMSNSGQLPGGAPGGATARMGPGGSEGPGFIGSPLMATGSTPATPATMSPAGSTAPSFGAGTMGMIGGNTPATPATTSPAGSTAPSFGPPAAGGGFGGSPLLQTSSGQNPAPGSGQFGVINSNDPGAAPGSAGGAPPQVLNNDLDPGYLARFQMGADALQNSAAAKGSILSGGTQKALDRYAQDYASNEYGNVYNRALSTAGFNAAQGQQGYQNQFNQAAFNAGQNQLGYQNQFNQAAFNAGQGQQGFENALGVAGFNAGQGQLGFQNQFGVNQFNANQGQLGFENQFGVGQFNAGQNQMGYQNRYGQYSDYMNWLNQAANRGLAGSQDLYSSPPM